MNKRFLKAWVKKILRIIVLIFLITNGIYAGIYVIHLILKYFSYYGMAIIFFLMIGAIAYGITKDEIG